MATRKRLAVATVERRLWRALKSERVNLMVGPLVSCNACVFFRFKGRRGIPVGALITVDIHRDGLITAVIHELLHYVFYAELSRWGELEEAIVLALEARIYAGLGASKRKLARWRGAIQAKLGQP